MNKTLNKIFICISLVFCLFVFSKNNVYAKTVPVVIDFDYNDSNTFNLFYELKNDTPISHLLVKYSYDYLDLFVAYDDYLLKNSYNSYTNNQNFYDYFKSYNSYCISVSRYGDIYYFYLDYIKFSYTLEFDINGNYLESSYTYDSGGHSIDGNYYYSFFSFLQGTMNYTGSNSYTLTQVINDGVKYSFDGVDLGPFNSIGNFFNKWFHDEYNYDSNWSFNLDYYKEHLIVGPNYPLKPVKEVFFGISDYDLKGYTSLYINEYAKGVILRPLTNDLDNSLYVYAYNFNADLYVNSMLLGVAEDGVTGTIDFDSDNIQGFNLAESLKVLPFPMSYFNLGSVDYTDYIYHFYTENATYELTLFYDPSKWEIVKENTSFKHNDITYVNSSDLAHKSITSMKGSLGHSSIGSGSSSTNSNDINSILNGYNPISIIGDLKVVLSSMFAFITMFLGFFPVYISTPLIFFFILGLAICIIKLMS